MASLYDRGNKIWISYRGQDGKWHDKTTGFSNKNPIEKKNADRLCKDQTLKERLVAPVTAAGGWEWVDSWLSQTWSGGTGYQYRRLWGKLQEWLKEKELVNPASVTREHCLGYKSWRVAEGVKPNTAVLEAKFLGQIMEEAVNQNRCSTNPARKLGLKREPVEGKRAWTDEELAIVDADLKKNDPFGWMRVTYLLGRYQAARIGSCDVPLHHINLNRKTIHYPKPKGGARKAYTQPIDPRLLPELRAIVEHRKKIGAPTLCDLPEFEKVKDEDYEGAGSCSLKWREYLDGLGIHGVSHKSLRITWITQAALSGQISEAVACQFSNHSSLTVHRIYQQFTTDDMAAMLDRLASIAKS
jgi:integrase